MTQQPKYELSTEINRRVGAKTVWIIRALRDFGDVKAGDWGGFIESEDNLSHHGDCWVYADAKVFDKARVNRDAKIMDGAMIYDYSMVSDNAVVAGQSKVFQRATIYGDVVIDGMCSVYGDAQVFGKVKVKGHSKIHDDAWVYGDIEIDGHANITQKCTQNPIVLTGFSHGITIMDDHISIDCQTKTFDEWRTITREEAFAMNGRDGLRLFKHIPDTLEFLVQKYRKKDSNV